MSKFRPLRSSPPPRNSSFTETLVPTSAVSDVSRSSIVSAPELAYLTSDEIDFIDAVISRASPSATTFLSVFKAYNDVLQERGLDPQNEVVYYGKLLKLGTLKGANWGEKWRVVKAQHGYATTSASRPKPTAKNTQVPVTTPKASAARLLQRLKTTLQHHEPTTAAELLTDDVLSQTEVTETELDYPQDSRHARTPSTVTNSLGLDIGSSSPPKSISTRHAPLWTSKNSEISQSAPSLSSVPPSYKDTTRTAAPLSMRPRRNTSRQTVFPSTSPPKPATGGLTHPPDRKGSIINEDDAWNKIRMAQDEKEADRFREEKLLERCWDVWKQGFDWIITTSEQIAQARDTLVLRLAIQKWRVRLASRRELEQRVTTFADEKCVKAAFARWSARLREKRQQDWRNEMRGKMRVVRERREAKLRKDAWAKWRQLYQSHLSGQHYTERLVLRAFRRWREKLGRVDQLEEAADHYVIVREGRAVARSWDTWRKGAELRSLETALAARVAGRTLREIVEVWRERTHDLRSADAYHDVMVMKFALRRWKASQARIRTLERRADKHVARQDDILVRAVTRVWKAHERGRLLERVRTLRLLKQSWETWKKRLRHQKGLEDKALAFALRPSSSLAAEVVRTWRKHHAGHRNALAFAVQYRDRQLEFKMLTAWRLHLRENLRLIRKAKKEEKLLVWRRAWRIWTSKLEERRREKKLLDLQRNKTEKLFSTWKEQALRRRRHRVAEQEIQNRTTTRVLRKALYLWNNRLLEIKDREFQYGQNYDKRVMVTSFSKWKMLYVRHVEELRLMESYQDIKREESMRRMFYKWLTAARSARHRRMTLLAKEEEMRRFYLIATWDKWRGRLQAERLLPLERTFGLQNQNAVMYRAFVTWHSKTKSLPAVRFHASHIKARFWNIWRDAMPRALQAKKAREMERKAVLSKALEKWLQAHRTKIALRAVARARYMRLPTSSSARPPVPAPRASGSRAIPLRKPARAPAPDTDLDTEAEQPMPVKQPKPRPASAITGIASALASRAARDSSPTRPRFSTRSTGTRDPSPARSRASHGTRDPSPTRSAVSRPASRGSLWMELKEIQWKSRTPTVRSSRSPEPP
ncbi:hypothetical protein BV25DRAFT_1852514 [Artomyces pyxidatus]|uniref:Uncharacterized protein n=1 Tax=Artomyces pyxidatus TaxID=48021 RepID=A0ACB8T8W2_9AGAM|nr:hypothetical protein BV25DRAFT_1852514 [Artomyces pyxidatus]